ncbi:MAG: hypothetical protein ACXABY_14895 [Candidatus Thorarchaeota archaeon]
MELKTGLLKALRGAGVTRGTKSYGKIRTAFRKMRPKLIAGKKTAGGMAGRKAGIKSIYAQAKAREFIGKHKVPLAIGGALGAGGLGAYALSRRGRQ